MGCQGRKECVFDVFETEISFVADEGDYVESDIEPNVVGADIRIGSQHQVSDFSFGNGILREFVPVAFAGFYLDDHQSLVAIGYNVDFLLPATPIDVADDISVCRQIFRRNCLSAFP